MNDIKIHCKFDEMLLLAQIKKHPQNKNLHSKGQILRLAEMYKYHGVRHPIIISKRSNVIVAGHARLLAAKELKMKEFPVVYQDFVNFESEYSFMVSDNAISAWSDLDLSGINLDLQDLGPDFDLDMLGIEDFTLDFSENDLGEDDESEDEAKSKTFKLITCPHCQQEFEMAQSKSRNL